MGKIHHVQYMKKKYGGSETLISLISQKSSHLHEISFAKDKAMVRPETPFYEAIISDFKAHIGSLILEKCDRIHTHFVFPGYFSQKKGFNGICSSHCLFSEEFKLAMNDTDSEEERDELKKANEYFSKLEKLFYPSIKNLVVHSEFHFKEVRNLNANPTFLELPLNVSDFDTRISKLEAKSIIRIPNRPTLLFLGRPTYLKGFSILAEAFQQIPKELGFQILVVGDFKVENNRLSYTPAVGASSNTGESSFYVGDNIFVIPPVNHNNVVPYFNAADFFVCPSFYEAIGYVNLEAMASKTPIIASNSSGIPYIVKDMQTGLLFESGNPKDLASKLVFALDSPTLLKRIVENARDFVQSYDAERVSPKYEDLYNSLFE